MRISESKNAWTIVKRLNPSNRFLFGEKLGQVAKNLKESDQVSAFI